MPPNRQRNDTSHSGDSETGRHGPDQLGDAYTQRTPIVAIAGNPNTGKSTLFNALTGLSQHVANFPGVTVEKRTGWLGGTSEGGRIKIVDVPGAYSLGATSEDEAVVSDVLLGRRSDVPSPDLILVSVDATNLARNLFLVTQILELGRPVVVAMNMSDLAIAQGIDIDAKRLSNELGCAVVPIVATKQQGLAELRSALIDHLDADAPEQLSMLPEHVEAELCQLCAAFYETNMNKLEQAQARMEMMQSLLSPAGIQEKNLSSRWGERYTVEITKSRQRLGVEFGSIVELEAKSRYAWIEKTIQQVITRRQPRRDTKTDKVDRILTNRFLGTAFLLVVMSLCFQAVYTWAVPLMDTIDTVFASLAQFVRASFPQGAFTSLMADGVIAGVGAVLVFLPQILILFLFLAILEDCGYLARAAFLLDRWMALLGLNGKALFPLLSSFACAVPGIMAARTIENKRDRFVTILIAPLMSCSARLPVYVLLIGALIPATPLLGGLLSAQAATLLAMYLVGVFVAIPIAWLLKKTIFRGEGQPFLMELPTYKWPSPSVVFTRMWVQGREFCVTAGTIIFAVSILIWALGYYPHASKIGATFEQQRKQANTTHDEVLAALSASVGQTSNQTTLRTNKAIAASLEEIVQIENSFERAVQSAPLQPHSEAWLQARSAADLNIEIVTKRPMGSIAYSLWLSDRALTQRLHDIDQRESGTYLRQSILGQMGQWIEPVVKPLGWDWRIGTAALASFPAREVFIATMGTIYNLGTDVDEQSSGLRSKLRSVTWPSGELVYNVPVALSVMVFFALCCQCGSTLAAIKREMLLWRWVVFTFVYMTSLAYVGAWATYRLALQFV